MPSSALTMELQQLAVLVVSFSYRSPFKPQNEAHSLTTNQESANIRLKFLVELGFKAMFPSINNISLGADPPSHRVRITMPRFNRYR